MFDNDQLIDRIERRTRRRSTFAVHATMYLFYGLCSIIFLLDPTFWRFMTLPNTGDITLILILWTAIFIAHLARFLIQETGDQQIQGIVKALSGQEKTKRERLILQEDGAVLFVDEADEERQQRLRDRL